MIALALVATVVLIGASAWFVAVEFALLASRPSRLSTAADDTTRSGRIAHAMARNIQPQLTAAQLGITLSTLILGYVAEPALARLLENLFEPWIDLHTGVAHTITVIVSLAVVAFFHIVLGEMVPKNIAIALPERTLVRLAAPTRLFVLVLSPLITLLTWVSVAGARLMGVEATDEISAGHGTAALGMVVRESADEGLIDRDDSDLIAGALDLGGRTTAEVLVERGNVVAMPRWSTVGEVEAVMARTGHSRIPLTGAGGLDEPVGFVHAKRLLTLGPESTDRPLPVQVISNLLVVEPERPLTEVLQAMRRTRRHIALVRNGSQPVLGLVTLEDALEALVGDIRDESDRLRRRNTWRTNAAQ
jgi:CBS domain containing-hemolysin-like protein